MAIWKYTVFVIGIALCAAGISAVAYPAYMRKWVAWVSVSWRLRVVAAIKTIIGVVFLVFARDGRLPWVVEIIGVLVFAGSLWFLTLAGEKQQKWVEKFQNKQDWFYRTIGVLEVLLGLLIAYAG